MTQDEFCFRFGDQESMTVEFKQQLQRASRMQEPMVAFANSRGGTIIVGVSDRRPASTATTSLAFTSPP